MWNREGQGGTRNSFQCGSNEQGEDQKKKVFSSKISTNSGYRLKILAIFHEFSCEDQKKKDQRSSSQKFNEIRCESTKSTKIRPVNTNLGVLGLALHSNSPSLLISSGHSPRLGGHKQSFGGTRPRNAPRGTGPAKTFGMMSKFLA